MNTAFESCLWGDPVLAAQRLLGCELVFGDCAVQIVETEGYRGSDDPGSHAFSGITPRTSAMHGPPGHAYVYFVYGNHWMLNVVAHEPNSVGAVLIRAARPILGLEIMRARRGGVRESELLNGPGKLCQALGIDSAWNGKDLLKNGNLRSKPPASSFLVGPRVGLAVGKGEDLPWRFVLSESSPWSSRPKLQERQK